MTVPCRPLEVPPNYARHPGGSTKTSADFFPVSGLWLSRPVRRYAVTPLFLVGASADARSPCPRAPRRRAHADASGAPAGWNGRCSTFPTSREGVTSTRTLPIFWSSCRSVPSSGSCRHSRRDLAVDHARAHGWAARRQRLSQPPGGGEGLLFVLRHHGARQRGDPSGRA